MSEEFEGVVRARKWGDSIVIVVPPEIRDFFGLEHRDMLAYRKVGRLVCFRRIKAGELLPTTEEEAQRAHSGVEVHRG